jgi:hypothetical protein
MNNTGTATHYYFTANTPQGRRNSLSALCRAKDGWRSYILTGCAPKQASELIARISASGRLRGEEKLFADSCDEPGRLSAVAFPSLEVSVIGSAPPDFVRPAFPGLCEAAFDMSECYDRRVLSGHGDELIAYELRRRGAYERAGAFLSASAGICGDTLRLALDCTRLEKIERYAAGLSRRLFPDTGTQGREEVRFLTSFCAAGVSRILPGSSYSEVYIIEDELGIGKIFVNKLRCAALSRGYDVVSCPSPLFPDGNPEHLLVPSLGVAFISAAPYDIPALLPGISSGRRIHALRFTDREALKLRRPLISFNKRACGELLHAACGLFSQANTARHLYESVFSAALSKKAFAAKEKALTELILASK